MLKGKTIHLGFSLVFSGALTVFGQWSAANSGTTNNLNGAYLLDHGVSTATGEIIDLNSPIGFVVGDGGTILRSYDAGMTWSSLTSGTTNALYDVYFFDPTQGIAVGEQGLILRTLNGGAEWHSVASGVKDALRSVSFSGVNGISGGDSQTILYSTDSGASWQTSQSGFFGGGFLGAHMLSATVGFVAGQNSIFQPLLGTTTDGGFAWNFQPFYFDKNEGGGTDVFFFDQNTGIVSGFVFDGRGAIARTTDGGMNWSTLFFDQPIEAIDFPQTTSGFAVGWAGRILHSTNMGITWMDETSGTSANLNDVSFANDALRGIVVGDGGTILWTADGGEPRSSPTPTPTSSPTATSTPTAIPTATGTPTATPTATATSTATTTPTPTATATGTATGTPTPRPTPTPRNAPTPRPRPTPPPRPILSQSSR